MTQYRDDEIHAGVFAARTPDKPAIIMDGGDQVMTFAQYEAISNQSAHLLRKCGLQRGDRVAIFMENNPHYLALAWGGLRAGLRVTTVATHLGRDEISYILRDSGAKALVTTRKLAGRAADSVPDDLPMTHRFSLGGSDGFEDFEAALNAQPSTPIRDQSEGVEMLYSSGTTGRPKAVKKPLPQSPFGRPPPSNQSFARIYGIDEGTVYFHPAPLYHAAPLMGHLRVIRYGGTCVVVEKFDAERALRLIEMHRVTHSQWVPTHFIRLLRLPIDTRRHYDLSSHKVAIHAAAPCPVDVKREMMSWWGPVIYEYYGGSEGNGYVAITPQEWLEKPGSVGRAKIGTLRICDDDGNERAVGEEGTVYFDGGPAFEYHNDPLKTASVHNAQGWSTLGDVGYVDTDGYLFLTDRKAFMIVSGGVNIYPQEAESILATHPNVMDVAVFGVPNTEFGEEVKAVVAPVDRSGDATALEAELIAYCRARLSPVKCPRSIDFRDALPRQDNGKLYKRKLRDQYWANQPPG